MTEQEKEYPISDDIALFYTKYVAARKVRNLAIKLPFGYKKALRAATDSLTFHHIFWDRVRAVYAAEIGNKQIEYVVENQTIREHKPSDEQGSKAHD